MDVFIFFIDIFNSLSIYYFIEVDKHLINFHNSCSDLSRCILLKLNSYNFVYNCIYICLKLVLINIEMCRFCKKKHYNVAFC